MEIYKIKFNLYLRVTLARVELVLFNSKCLPWEKNYFKTFFSTAILPQTNLNLRDQTQWTIDGRTSYSLISRNLIERD